MTTTTTGEDRFLDFHQQKSITSISRGLVYRLIARGDFPHPVKLGKKSVWPESEIRAWMQREIEKPRPTGRPSKYGRPSKAAAQ